MLDETRPWDGEVRGPEFELRVGANGVPTENRYYWAEVTLGGQKRRFYLNISQDVRRDVELTVGHDYEDVLKECLADHIRDRIRNHNWIPAENEELSVNSSQALEQIKHAKPRR